MKVRRLLYIIIPICIFALGYLLGNYTASKSLPDDSKGETSVVNDNSSNTEEQETKDDTNNNEMGDKKMTEGISKLHVEGTQLMDENGNAVVLKGLSTHGIAWFPDYINEDCIRQLKEDMGINVLRLAMYTAEYNGYCTGGNQEELKALIDKGVKITTDNDMYVIIDWHILSDNNPNIYKEQSKAFFQEMSEKYKDNPNVIYEICNEPNGGTSWQDIKSYANEIIPIIRANAKDAIIIVGTPNWSQFVNEAAADPITGYDNIMYSLHFYAGTHKEDLRNTMVNAIQSGIPVFVTEFGICDASGNGNVDEGEANQWVSVMNDHQVSYIMWNISNKDESSAIFKPDCNKYSDFTEDDLRESGLWFKQMMGK